MSAKAPSADIWTRRRGHAFFHVDDPDAVARKITPLFTQGGDDFVIIRADVVEGCDFNLVIPIDASEAAWDRAVAMLEEAVGASAAILCEVVRTYPAVPHQAHCFVTEAEHRAYPLHEYFPPGRHPKSPGANPWG